MVTTVPLAVMATLTAPPPPPPTRTSNLLVLWLLFKRFRSPVLFSSRKPPSGDTTYLGAGVTVIRPPLHCWRQRTRSSRSRGSTARLEGGVGCPSTVPALCPHGRRRSLANDTDYH